MRIGISAHFWPYVNSGSGQYLRHLVQGLAKLESHHTLFLIAERGVLDQDPPPFPTIEVGNRLLPSGRPAKLWFEQLGLPWAARSLKLDLLHVPYLAPPLVSPVPTIVTVHDLIPILLPAYRGNWRKRAYTRLALQATRRAEALIAVSNYTAADIERHLGFSAQQIYVTPEAAAPHLQPASPQEVTALHERYDLPGRYILHLGDTDRRKGVHRLLRAFAQWHHSQGQEEVGVVVAGPLHPADDLLYLDLPALARSLGIADHVRFLGPIPETDKAAFYSGAELFVLLSAYEGFGLPPLEAMACGTPVVVSDATSLPEVVGQAGVLVDHRDQQAVAQTLGELLADPARRMELSQRGLKRAASFSWDRTARQTMQAYEAVVH